MSVGLLALLDDVAGLAKVAAASLDDVAGQAFKAGAKATGAVIDDAAVTPRYVQGFAADRELPIVGRIAAGSLRNKLLILLPVALLLSIFLPWAISPLLMIGGAYLCYEGAEKVYEALFPHNAHEHEAQVHNAAATPQALEETKVAGAIKTDFILSAEIMAIALAAITAGDFWTRAIILVVVAVGITVAVYGGVALIVKADDFGLRLASTRSDSVLGRLSRSIGQGLVVGMPVFMSILSVVGTAAMIWVGGGIIVHGLEEFGISGPGHFIHDLAEGAAHAVPALEGLVNWLVTSAASGIFGIVLGAILIPVAEHVVAPLWGAAKRLVGKGAKQSSHG